MNQYHVYELGGANTRHAGTATRHPNYEAESAQEALRAFDPPGTIKINAEDDTALSAFADNADNVDKQGLEHMLCADRLLED